MFGVTFFRIRYYSYICTLLEQLFVVPSVVYTGDFSGSLQLEIRCKKHDCIKIGFLWFCLKKNKIVTNLDLINGGDRSLDFNGGHHFEGFLDGGRAHFFVAESDSSAQGLRERKNVNVCPKSKLKAKLLLLNILSSIKLYRK